MKKLLIATAALVTSLAAAKSTTYDGEFFADTKGSAPSSAPWVHPTNVVSIANKVFHAWWDPFESTYLPGTSVNFFNSQTNEFGLPKYPSYTFGSFNVNLGIDNIVGDATRIPDKTAYSVAIGTSDKSLGMHSYAFGSQLNVITNNATAIGYGLTAMHPWSTVIGHGKRPTTNGVNYDYTNTAANVATYLQSVRNNIFPGFHLYATDTHQVLTITECLSSPNLLGMYYNYVITNESDYPDGIPDWVLGQYDWRYGITHGPGTYNIVTWHSNYGTKSPGLKSVYINGDRLDDLVRKEIAGPNVELTNVQKSKNIGFDGSGYDENSPVELGVNASAALNPTVVAGVTTSRTKLRNAGIAIGARAVAEGTSDLKNQSISIGLAAYSSGSSMIAIGPGSKDSTETDWTGNNTFASGPGKNGTRGGSASTAIGYSAKAWGTQALAIGSGDSGTSKPATIASNDYTTAVGPSAQALAPKSVAIGRSAQSKAEGAVQIGTGTNSTPNSLQFMGVKIVENGRLLGGNADPKELSITPTTSTELEFSIDPGSVMTILPSSNCGPGTEIAISPTSGLRNYEIYLPNEPEVREGLPAGFSLDELPAEITQRVVKNHKWQAYKLPAKITLKQPYSKLVIAEIEEMDDGSSWDPGITNCNLRWSFDQQKFITIGKKLLEGTNLHAGVSMKLAYPISGGKVSTNELFEVNTDGILDGTFYGWTMSAEFVPTGIITTSGDNSWFEIIYETSAGTKPAVWHQEFDMSE